MKAHTISTAELHSHVSRVRAGLARGERYVIVHRSKPVARLEPVASGSAATGTFQAGGLRLQAKTQKVLTPKYLKKLAGERYE